MYCVEGDGWPVSLPHTLYFIIFYPWRKRGTHQMWQTCPSQRRLTPPHLLCGRDNSCSETVTPSHGFPVHQCLQQHKANRSNFLVSLAINYKITGSILVFYLIARFALMEIIIFFFSYLGLRFKNWFISLFFMAIKWIIAIVFDQMQWCLRIINVLAQNFVGPQISFRILWRFLI